MQVMQGESFGSDALGRWGDPLASEAVLLISELRSGSLTQSTIRVQLWLWCLSYGQVG